MNKHGWGLRVELFIIVFFIACLLFSTIGLSKFGLVENSNLYDEGGYYRNVENNLANSALNYFNNKFSGYTGDGVIIKSNTLVASGYLNKMYDKNDRECTGYVKVFNSSVASAYIKCSKYKTTGYDSDYE